MVDVRPPIEGDADNDVSLVRHWTTFLETYWAMGWEIHAEVARALVLPKGDAATDDQAVEFWMNSWADN